MRALLLGAGEAGRRHLTALAATPELEVAGIVEPAPLPDAPAVRVPVFTDYRQALATVRPELVVVATPPHTSLPLARQAAATGARVLVEKPVVIDPAELEHDVVDARIAVAFQPHFAPGLAALLAAPPQITRARVALSCRRDAGYYRGWRARWATAGGILHQQAIHGLALAVRLLPTLTVAWCTAEVEHRRHFSDAEDAVRARISFADGRELLLTGRVDSEAPSRHEVHLTCACGGEISVTGRNLEAGLESPRHGADAHRTAQRALPCPDHLAPRRPAGRPPVCAQRAAPGPGGDHPCLPCCRPAASSCRMTPRTRSWSARDSAIPTPWPMASPSWPASATANTPLREFGAVLHHNLDKVAVLGGRATFGPTSGHYVHPLRIVFGGRASRSFAGTPIPLAEILITAARDQVQLALPGYDQTLVEMRIETTDSSKFPHWFTPRSLADLPERTGVRCNDTAYPHPGRGDRAAHRGVAGQPALVRVRHQGPRRPAPPAR